MSEIERATNVPLPVVPVPDGVDAGGVAPRGVVDHTQATGMADPGSTPSERGPAEAHGPARALEPEGVPEILARLRRAHGQLGGVIHMIETERSCQDIVTQLSAVAKAVQRAGFAVITQGMQQCLTDPGASDVDLDEMEKLFLRLA